MSKIAVKYTARNFTEKEFECKCADSCNMKGAGESMSALIVIALDLIRDRLGKPVRVNSGKRCVKHNAAVGGVSESRHARAEAADISAGDYAALVAAAVPVCEMLGLRIVRYDKERFLHIQEV